MPMPNSTTCRSAFQQASSGKLKNIVHSSIRDDALTNADECSLNVRRGARGKIDMGAYRMRFLWADEIDADHAHYQKLLQRWGSDEAIDDMEHAFGSLFWQMPERVPSVALDAQTGQAAFEEAAALWAATPSARWPGWLRDI